MLKLQSKPWINSHIKKLMNYQDKLFNTMIKTPSPSNRYLYKKFRNRVVSEQRRFAIFKIILKHIKPISKCYGQTLNQ